MSLPKFPINPADITRDDAINMILTSIAMEEVGLSHILNAEGEKIQYVLGTLSGTTGPGATIEDVLSINESVTDLLKQAAGNQQALSDKMQAVLSAPTMIGPTGATGPVGPSGGETGATGADGESAYDIAVDNGFVGTEVEWLESLVGATGADGAIGADGATGATGADGESAYDIAVDNGFVGTEEEWLESLVGATGATGPTITNEGFSAYLPSVNLATDGQLTDWTVTSPYFNSGNFNATTGNYTVPTTARYLITATINYSTTASISVSLGSDINPAFAVEITSPASATLLSGLFPLLDVNVALVLDLRAVLGNGTITLAGEFELTEGDVVGLFYVSDGLTLSLDIGGSGNGTVWSINQIAPALEPPPTV